MMVTTIPSFESGVNPEGIQTCISCSGRGKRFESGVNPEGIQTNLRVFEAS